jgi:hypothetical protein
MLDISGAKPMTLFDVAQINAQTDDKVSAALSETYHAKRLMGMR